MTPREFELKYEGLTEFEAWKVILNQKAKHEKELSIDKLLNRQKKFDPSKVVSLEEHKALMDDIEKRIKGG